MSGKAALLCLLALLGLVATQATAESIDVTSITSLDAPRRLLSGSVSKTVTVEVVHGSKTVEKAAPAEEEEESAPAPVKAAAKDEVVVVMVPHHCKMWAKFGHIHPSCKHYYQAAGRKL